MNSRTIQISVLVCKPSLDFAKRSYHVCLFFPQMFTRFPHLKICHFWFYELRTQTSKTNQNRRAAGERKRGSYSLYIFLPGINQPLYSRTIAMSNLTQMVVSDFAHWKNTLYCLTSFCVLRQCNAIFINTVMYTDISITFNIA